jgi:hypothetical protein
LFFFLSFFEIRMRAFSCNGGAQVFILIMIRCRKIILRINLGMNCCFLKPFDFGFSVLY